MDDKLILVEKDGERIEIHPLALENCKQLGWKVVEEKPQVSNVGKPPEAPAAPTKEPKAPAPKAKAGKKK
jgi:hypothetical protein